jgi:glycosyltransferase involved in cell wall biosynthesis/peptidoglycan/xylan/chitin deacetylase (PgdA/CDA1 family)
MKKVLIISYFYLPGNFAGSYRVASWVKYLNEFGYYPIVVTRHWNEGQTGFTDISDRKNIHIEKSGKSEIHYLPYKGNLRDKLLRKSRNRFSSLRRLLSIGEILLQNFTIRVIPFNNLYYYSKKYLANNPDVNVVVISARPFILFHFGYLLKKHFPYLNWIADYRDPWNTHEYFNTVQNKQIRAIESRSEKKWISRSSIITSCSELWCNQLSEYTGIRARAIYNGYDAQEWQCLDKKNTQKNSSEFTLLYNGTLYQMQNIDNIFDGIINLIKNGKDQIRICLVGMANDTDQVARIHQKIKGYELHFQLTARVSQKEIIQKMHDADLFLMFGYGILKGCYPVKLFEYLAGGKPILMSPSDHDVIEEVIKECQAGFVSDNADEVFKYLSDAYDEWKTKGVVAYNGQDALIEKYSRSIQAGALADIMDGLLSGKIANVTAGAESHRTREIISAGIHKLGITKILHKKIDRSRVRVLCFHNISLDSIPAYPSLSPEHFRKLMSYFSKEFDIIPLFQVTDIPISVKKPMVLTFDDGYCSFYNNALPVLKEFNLPAHNNVIVECVGSGKFFWTQRLNNAISHIYRTNRKFYFNYDGVVLTSDKKTELPHKAAFRIYRHLLYLEKSRRDVILDKLEIAFDVPADIHSELMDWDTIKKCMQSGIRIGSHTMSHDSLTTIDSGEQLKHEIADSKTILEQQLGVPIDTLAFPNGVYNERCIRIAEQSGYKILLGSEENHLRLNQENLMAKSLLIPRISINRNRFYEDILKAENLHNILRFRI